MDIKTKTLSSGLRVVSINMPGLSTASVAAFVAAGCRDEHPDTPGVAHFMEHMAFKGTSTRNSVEIAKTVELLGASINAYTSYDETCFHVSGLAEAARTGIEIIGDMMTNSLFAEEHIEAERGVIIQEMLRSADDPMDLAYDGYHTVAFSGHAISRPILGDARFVMSATADDFRSFVGANYDASNLLIIAAGAVRHDEICEQVEKAFERVPAAAVGRRARDLPIWTGGKVVRAKDGLEQSTVLLGFQSVRVGHPYATAYDVLSEVLGGGMSSPLFQEIREKRSLAYATGCWNTSSIDWGTFMIHAGTDSARVQEAALVSLAELASIAGGRVVEDDLIRARNSMLTRAAAISESPRSLARAIGGGYLDEGTLITPERRMARIRSVTREEVAEAAWLLLSSKLAVSIVGPEELSERVDLAALSSSIGQ